MKKIVLNLKFKIQEKTNLRAQTKWSTKLANASVSLPLYPYLPLYLYLRSHSYLRSNCFFLQLLLSSYYYVLALLFTRLCFFFFLWKQRGMRDSWNWDTCVQCQRIVVVSVSNIFSAVCFPVFSAFFQCKKTGKKVLLVSFLRVFCACPSMSKGTICFYLEFFVVRIVWANILTKLHLILQ